MLADSPAGRSGVAVGDRLLSVDGGEVRTLEALDEALENAAGRAARLTVERGGVRRTFTLKLPGRRPEPGRRRGPAGR